MRAARLMGLLLMLMAGLAPGYGLADDPPTPEGQPRQAPLPSAPEPNAQEGPAPKLWGLFIGISKYRDSAIRSLDYADKDAEALEAFVRTPMGGGFRPENIRLLVNEAATRDAIWDALREFLKKPGENDLVLIHIAAHGGVDPDRPANAYLLPYDTDRTRIASTAIPMEHIVRDLPGTLLAKKAVFLVDACHAGAVGPSAGSRATPGAEAVNRFLEQVSASRAGWGGLAAAQSVEVAREDSRWGGGHGVFTWHVLEGLRGKADRDGDGMVQASELFTWVTERVEAETRNEQHPKLIPGFDPRLKLSIPGGKGSVGTLPATSAQPSSFDPDVLGFAYVPPWAEKLLSAEQRAEAARLGLPAAFTEPHTKMRFVLIPGGTFMMGSPEEEEDRGQGEVQHEVTLSPFYMSIYEVTNRQYRMFDSGHDSGRYAYGENQQGRMTLDGEDQPAGNVSYVDAIELATWLSQVAPRRGFRLPSEAQWEYACRAGSTSSRPWGDDDAAGPRYSNWNDPLTRVLLNKPGAGWMSDDGHRVSAPVGSYLPNRWGLYDMLGNVWEWCSDRWGPLDDASVVDPEGPGGDLALRVKRGGAWCDCGNRTLRSALRTQGEVSEGDNHDGVRIALPAARLAIPKSPWEPPWARERLSREQREEAVRLALPAAFEDPLTGMRFVLIPSKFDPGAPGPGAREPRVLLRPFYIGAHMVTNDEYRKLMRRSASEVARPGDERQPLVNVSHDKASAFVKAMSDQGRVKGYRLPSEAQWLRAALEGTSWPDPTAAGEPSPLTNPNAWGLYSTGSDVDEWCSDWFGEVDQSPGADPEGPASGTRRVVRGPVLARSSSRYGERPQGASSTLGFRVALPASALEPHLTAR